MFSQTIGRQRVLVLFWLWGGELDPFAPLVDTSCYPPGEGLSRQESLQRTPLPTTVGQT